MGELKDRIKKRREALEMSQDELASTVGYKDRSTISKIEKGVNDITQSKISTFAEALKTTEAYLMGWTNDPYDYDNDPDNRFEEIPIAQFEYLQKSCNNDLERIWHTWESIQDESIDEYFRIIAFADRLHKVLEQKNIKRADLIKLTGISETTINAYLNGAYLPDQQDIHKIADALNVSMASFMCEDIPIEQKKLHAPNNAIPLDLSELKRIPILGHIAVGLSIFADENIEGYTYADLNDNGDYFALRVQGDSMNALRINDGDIVIVRQQPIVDNGEVAVVLVDDECATLKRFYQTKNIVTLMPQSTNPIHKPQMYNLSDTSIRVLGKVIKVEFTL